MTFIKIFISTLFIGINLWILACDIRTRKIPNILILILWFLLPFWLWIFPGESIEKLISSGILSLSCIVWGIFYYKESGIFGAGDIKYGALLLLFLAGKPISLFIGNIGILTFLTLIFWCSLLIGRILSLRGSIVPLIKNLSLSRQKMGKMRENLLLSIFDWVIIGFLLSFFIKDFWALVLHIEPLGNWEYFFLLSLIIFLLRPRIRSIITNPERRSFSLFVIIFYVGYLIERNWYEIFWSIFISYISNIWMYALFFTGMNTATRKLFRFSDTLFTKKWSENTLHTIPYSVIIFWGFFLGVFFDINLLTLLGNTPMN